MSQDNEDLRDKRNRNRATRIKARRLLELSRSVLDGLVVVAATFVGVAVEHGADWVIAAMTLLFVLLVVRAIAMWVLIPASDELLETIDSHEATLDSIEQDRRRRDLRNF